MRIWSMDCLKRTTGYKNKLNDITEVGSNSCKGFGGII